MLAKSRWLFSAAAVVVLGGCATNAIRLDRAETMVAAGRAAGEATEELMARVRATNREALLDVVAADPACRLPEPAIAVGEGEGLVFCRPGGLDSERYPEDFALHRVTRTDFGPTIAVLKGLAGYLDSVDEVLTDEPLGIADQIAEAYGDLQVFQAAILAVSGSNAAPIGLNADQQAAITGALGLLDTILTEQARVDRLRTLESPETRAQFTSTLAALGQANHRWLTDLNRQLSYRQTLAESRLDGASGADKRRPAAQAQLEFIGMREDLPQLRVALEEVVARLGKTHAAYLALLDDDDAPLTMQERRKRARLERERAIGALKSLTAILKAF